MARPLSIAAAALATTAALLMPTAPSTAAPTGDRADKTPTTFAFRGSGFGTRVQGGQLPAGSDTTAYQSIGCTNLAGLDSENHEANADLGGLTAAGVRSHVWTEQKNGVTSSYSQHSVAKITLGSQDAGILEINAIKSEARAFHDSHGYHSQTKAHIASIIYTPDGGDPQGLDIPTPDQPLVVPGLARISIGSHVRKHSGLGAKAAANAIDILVIPTQTRIRIAHSSAQIAGGVTYGLFRGYAAATRVRAVDDKVSSGPTPLMLMPCQGTHGKTQEKGAARVSLADDALGARAVHTEQWSTGNRDSAEIREESSIARINLGGGQLVIKGIVGRAHVSLTRGSRIKSDAKGTHILEILVNGDERHFPKTGVIEIPGLVRIQDSIVKRTKTGIEVTALRLTLLDGTGAKVDLGVARASIRRSGLKPSLLTGIPGI
jgi:hypothetical protein